MWAVGRRSEAGPLRLMTKGGCREARPRMGTRSLPVTNASSRFFCASVKPWTASQNHTITCTARQTERSHLRQDLSWEILTAEFSARR